MQYLIITACISFLNSSEVTCLSASIKASQAMRVEQGGAKVGDWLSKQQEEWDGGKWSGRDCWRSWKVAGNGEEGNVWEDMKVKGLREGVEMALGGYPVLLAHQVRLGTAASLKCSGFFCLHPGTDIVLLGLKHNVFSMEMEQSGE